MENEKRLGFETALFIHSPFSILKKIAPREQGKLSEILMRLI
jgi:hypothetical protein